MVITSPDLAFHYTVQPSMSRNMLAQFQVYFVVVVTCTHLGHDLMANPRAYYRTRRTGLK